MEALAALLTRTEDEHALRLRRALFGAVDAATVARLLADHVEGALAPADASLFVHDGVGLVVGLRLVDGRRVVIKVHRWQVSVRRLAAIQDMQRVLAAQGLPAPRPLHRPTILGQGIATVEEMLPGQRADGHDPAVRWALAGMLAEFIRVASGVDPRPPVGDGVLTRASDGPLWGEPHDLRFDFDATAVGVEWIDALARRAREELAEVELHDVVAHLDWRVQNLAFDGHDVVAIHDWDSVGVAPEPVAVGQAAAQFSTDWTVGWETLPAVAEMQAFVRDYEAARGRPFTADERRVLDAANLLLCAYGARCEHSDRILYPELAGPVGGGWGGLLEARGLDALR